MVRLGYAAEWMFMVEQPIAIRSVFAKQQALLCSLVKIFSLRFKGMSLLMPSTADH
jgi:hypothetical protein